MLRSSLAALRRGAAAPAAAAAATVAAAAAFPAEQATWFTRRREGGVESAINLHFINISMRSAEVKACDLSATALEGSCSVAFTHDEGATNNATKPQQPVERASRSGTETISPDEESRARMLHGKGGKSDKATPTTTGGVIAYPVKNSGECEMDLQRQEAEKKADRKQLADASNSMMVSEAQLAQAIAEGQAGAARFGDGGCGVGETLRATQPIKMSNRRKGQWGAIHFGKVWNQPRNFAHFTAKAWHKKFRMKKHRYTKRWRKRRYKVAALANLPFARRLRVDMIPRLQQGKKKASSEAVSVALEDVSVDAQDLVVAAVRGKTKTGVKARYRPKSKYCA